MPLLSAMAATLLLAAIAHLSWAPSGPGFSAVLAALFGDGDALDRQIVLQLRLPRLLVAVFGGASLGLAGTVMQAAFRNPLASPDVAAPLLSALWSGAKAERGVSVRKAYVAAAAAGRTLGRRRPGRCGRGLLRGVRSGIRGVGPGNAGTGRHRGAHAECDSKTADPADVRGGGPGAIHRSTLLPVANCGTLRLANPEIR
jgi:hypothetical protein